MSDWLHKYPRAQAMLQGDEDVLEYAPDDEHDIRVVTLDAVHHETTSCSAGDGHSAAASAAPRQLCTCGCGLSTAEVWRLYMYDNR